MNAVVVKRGTGPTHHITDPMNKTLHMAIRKERARKEAERAKQGDKGPQVFNGIRGLDKLGGVR